QPPDDGVGGRWNGHAAPAAQSEGRPMAALARTSVAHRTYPRGRPRPRVAMMLRWISEVPPAMVLETAWRYPPAARPWSPSSRLRSQTVPLRPCSFRFVAEMRWPSSEVKSLDIEASWLGTWLRVWMVMLR